MTASLRVIARDQLDFLALRPIKPDLKNDYARYLAWGLSATWLAGMGRYWDNPKAALWQKAGLGSLAYVFVMAALIWLIAAPLRPRRWSYRTVLLFVTLTSPPAILYAIPVEMFMSFSAAATANAVFLLVVATWRVVLLANYLLRGAGLRPLEVIVATLLPLTLIMTALALLNLEHATFQIMGGFGSATAYDAAYRVVLAMTILSYLASPVLVAIYGWLVLRARNADRNAPGNTQIEG